MNKIIFNGKNCYDDFNVILNYLKPQPPAPKIVKDSVAGMNSYYDFSTVVSNGEIVYDKRKIQCSLTYVQGKSKAELMIEYSKLIEWLLSGEHELIYTGEPDMKYIAQVEEAPSFDVFAENGGTFIFTFAAEPFKQGLSKVGSEQIWDSFNFLTDYLEDTEFDINESKSITIYNPGRSVAPQVSCDSQMTCILNEYTAIFPQGDSIDYGFKLQNGANTVKIEGTGHITFNFRKETL